MTKITTSTGTSTIRFIDDEEAKERGMRVVIIDREHPFVYEIEFSSEDLNKTWKYSVTLTRH